MTSPEPSRPLNELERRYLALLIQGVPKSQFRERLGCTSYAMKEAALGLLFKYGVCTGGLRVRVIEGERILVARLLGTDGPPCEKCERRRSIIDREIAHPARRWAWIDSPRAAPIDVPASAAESWQRLQAIEAEAAELRDLIQLELAREAAAA